MTPELEARARGLLRPGEHDLPVAVVRVADFLEERSVWFLLSRNEAARGCKDAAYKRNRLGHKGIPLHDEMKSSFGRLGDGRYVVAHCRADRMLDADRLAKTLDAPHPPARLHKDEIQGLGVAYGLVNPFIPWGLDGQLLASPVLHVFDDDLLEPVGIPSTVMTNAGDLTWGVELRVAELVATLPPAGVRVGDFAMPDPAAPDRPPRTRPTIGIITGNAPESGMALWDRVNVRVRELLGDANYGDVSMPRVVVASLPEMGLSMELADRGGDVWPALRQAADDLCRSGVTLLALACNTTHHFALGLSEVCARHGADFVSMPQAVADWLRHRGVRRVALVGIRYVAELGPWSAYRDPLGAFEVEQPGERAKARLDELAYQVKQEGANEAGLTRLRDILRQEVEADHVVLALTELSLLLDRQRKPGRSGKTLVDPLDVYADALAARFLGCPFPLVDPEDARRSP